MLLRVKILCEKRRFEVTQKERECRGTCDLRDTNDLLEFGYIGKEARATWLLVCYFFATLPWLGLADDFGGKQSGLLRRHVVIYVYVREQ